METKQQGRERRRETYVGRDNSCVRDECMENGLNRPDHLTKHSVTETIFTSETIMWKPGLK